MSVIKILIQLARLVYAFIKQLAQGSPEASVPASLPAPAEPTPPPEEPTTTPEVSPGGVTVEPAPVAVPASDRRGTFIITDVYPRDLDDPHTPQIEVPPFQNLVGLRFGDVKKLDMVGCYVKASQGLGWGAANEDWFRKCWRRIKEVGGDRYGTDWFRGAYHFLVFQRDGAAQADYFMRLIDQAGGWSDGDLMPWVDVEEGGQGTWAGGQKLEDITDVSKRKRLADEVTKCTTDFIARVKQHVPGIRVGLYGRGVFRDLRMSHARFGADAVCNPAYTRTMPPMDAYGWPVGDIVEWQLCGDGDVHCPGFPSEIPGWGKEDYSVYIDGANKTDLVSMRARVLAKPR